MLCKQHLSKQEDEAQHLPRNPSPNPGHTDCDSKAWHCHASLQCPSSTPSYINHPQCGVYSSSAGRAHLEKAKSRSCSQGRDFYIWSTTNLLPFLDELRKHMHGRVTHLNGKEHPCPGSQLTAVTGTQQHCCSQTHACSSVWLCPKAVRSWTHSGNRNHFVFNKGISLFLFWFHYRGNGVHSNMGCTELLSCVCHSNTCTGGYCRELK